MEHFFIENKQVKELTKEEAETLKGRNVTEVIKEMSPEQLKAFKKERYEKFIKPLMEHNMKEPRRGK